MAEFTEFMNKRVEHFFLMFKELRSGSITYPEIAKRENVRPPINKVCQKLGVKKVAQMTSDEALLQAITSVVYDIEMKRQARLGEGGDYVDGGSADIDDVAGDEFVFRTSSSSDQYATSPGMDKNPGASSTTPAPVFTVDASKSRKNQKAQQTKDRLAGLAKGDSSHSSPNKTTEEGNLSHRSNSTPLIGDSAELLKLALAVRAFNGRIQKALLQAQQRPGASPELVNMNGADVQNLVKSLCAIIGCKRLDCTVSQDATTKAVERYVQINKDNTSPHNIDGKSAFSADSTDFSVTESTPLELNMSSTANVRSSPLDVSGASSGLQIETPGLPSPSAFGPSFSPAHGAHNGYYPQFPLPESQALQINANLLRTVSPVHTQKSPVARVPLTLNEVYAEFWELSYKLFLYVCNPYRHCQECLCVVEDLVNLLENCVELRSPLTALALDSVIQRAMYELSDKVSRPIDATTLQALRTPSVAAVSAVTDSAVVPTDTNTASEASDTTSSTAPVPPTPLPPVTQPDCSVRNIEMCIALMSRHVSPICSKIREDYYVAHRLPSPQLGQSTWCDKVLTLTRQLQELIAWSSPHCQARVPAYVPSRRHSFQANGIKDTLFTDRSLSDTTTSSSGGANVAPEPKVIDFISALSPNTATEIVTALKLKDATLCEVLRQIGSGGMYAKLPHDLESSIQLNLHKVIHQSISGDCSIVLCGAAVLGLSDAQSKIKLDFAALAAPYHTNAHDLSLDEQRADLEKFHQVTEQVRELERAVENDKLTEIAWKHLKACARDFHSQSQDYIIKLTNASPDSQQQTRGYGGHNNGYDYQNNHNNNNYHNKYVLQPPQYGDRAYQNPQFPQGGGSSPTVGMPPELILEIAEDAESIRKIGDALVEKYFAQRIERTNEAPVINQILRKIEEINENVDKNERERVNFVRKFSKSLDRVLKENRYLYVRMVSNKARFTHINFEHQVAPHLQVSVNVIGCNPLPVQMTELINDYISLDGTGKVRDFLQTVKLFASAHHISDPASGYLSSTAWYVMALHVLLKHGLLPNVHHARLFAAQKPRSPTNSPASAAVTTTITDMSPSVTATQPLSARTTTPRAPYTPRELPFEYRDRLQSTSLLVLLDLFFRYYVEQVNLFTSVVTLREQGALLAKVEWPANPVLWRLSIEDPFESLGSPKPYDLGSTLSRPGQLTTFKALRRAVYGIHSIMADTSSDCHENISRLFSRVELINLARRSDYMGAVITASPAWVRPHHDSILDSAPYTEHVRSLYKKYEAPEALQLLYPSLSPRDSEFSSPGTGSGRKSVSSVNALSSQSNKTQSGASLSAKATEFQPSWLTAPSASTSAHTSVHGSAPNSARSGMGHGASPPPGPGYKQPYNQQTPVQGGNYPYTKGQGGPHLTQHNHSQGQGFDQRGRGSQYRDEPPQPPHAHQQSQQHQSNTTPRAPYGGGGTVNLNNRQAVSDPRYNTRNGPGSAYNQQHQTLPPPPQHQGHGQGQQHGQGRPFDPTAAALAASAERRYPVNQMSSAQTFDPKARKGLEQQQQQPYHQHATDRYNQGAVHPQHSQQQQLHQQQFANHGSNNLSARGDAPRYAVLEERYAKTETADDRYHSGNLAPRGGDSGSRYGGLGNQSARHEPSRYPAEDLQGSGSMSARYASLEDRYGYGSPPTSQLTQQAPLVQQHQQMQQRQPEPVRQSTLPQGFKLDLQPRFAEDRYNYDNYPSNSQDMYAQDSARSVSATSSAYPSARGDDRGSSYTLGSAAAPVNIGNLSARRLNDLTALTSPRMGYGESSANSNLNINLHNHNLTPSQPLSLSTQALAQVNEQKQKKSPLVPLIPLEGISNFSGSSGNSEYSNPLYSDRSSHYISTGRSDGLGDTGRSTLVPGGMSGAYYGPPGSGRSTGTQHQPHGQQAQYPSALHMGNYGHMGSAPNTSRSVEFSLGASNDSNDDYRQGYFGNSGGMNGISMTARSLEDSLLTDRSPTHSSDSLHAAHSAADSMLTNRLDYMGLEDLSANKSGLALPLSAVRPPQSFPPQPLNNRAQGNSEFDDMLTRLNQSSLSNSQHSGHSHSQNMSMSQSSGGRASFIGELPLNSARSGQSASSNRASNASIVIPSEVLDFGLHYNSGNPERRESLRSDTGRASGDLHTLSGSSHSLYPVVPQRAPSITLNTASALDLQGLLGYPSEGADLFAKSGGAAVGAALNSSSCTLGGTSSGGEAGAGNRSYLHMLFDDAPALEQE